MTNHTERSLEIAQIFPAHDETAAQVLAATPDKDHRGRGPWFWIRLANGDLALAVFPQGDLYEELQPEVQADYNDATHGAGTAPELYVPLRSLTLTESDLRDRGLMFNTEGVTELLKVALRAKLDLLGETSTDTLAKWSLAIGDFRVWAGELGVEWSDEFIPEYVRDRLGIRLPSDAQRAFDALTDEQKLALAAQTFQILEYDQNGNPGSEWSSDTTQALGDLFSEQYGIKFTDPGAGDDE